MVEHVYVKEWRSGRGGSVYVIAFCPTCASIVEPTGSRLVRGRRQGFHVFRHQHPLGFITLHHRRDKRSYTVEGGAKLLLARKPELQRLLEAWVRGAVTLASVERAAKRLADELADEEGVWVEYDWEEGWEPW